MFGITNTAHAGLIFKAPSSIGLISGLVGYWSFDGPDMAATSTGSAALDRSGNNNLGYLINGPQKTEGKIGQALSLDGVNDYVSVAAGSSNNNLSQISVSAWIFARSFGGGSKGRIVEKSVNQGWTFNINNTDCAGCAEFFVSYNGNTTSLDAALESNALATGRWQHIVVTWDGGLNRTNVKYYVDGVSKGQQAGDPGKDASGVRDSDSGLDLLIGNKSDNSRQFDGLIDEVRVYNRALNENEVRRLYRMGATLKLGSSQALNTDSLKQGLVGYWSFDGPDMAGTTAYDRSGKGNNGTLTNGPFRAEGKIGQTLSFDGCASCAKDDVVAVSSASLDNLNTLTYTAWIYPKSIGEADAGYIIGKDVNSGKTFRLQSNNRFECYIDRATVDADALSANDAIVLNSWQFVACTFDTTNGAKIFLGSEMKASGGGSGTPDTDDTDTFNIGNGDSSGFSRTFDGFIDEVHVYNRVLNETEIRRLYRMGATLKIGSSQASNTGSLTQGLVGYWSFDGPDMAGNIAYDRSGSYATGTLTNAPQRVEGRIGQGLVFDGVNDYVDINNPPSLANSSFSVGMWVKQNRVKFGSIFDVIFSQGSAQTTDESLHMGFASDNNNLRCGFFGDDQDSTVSYLDLGWHYWVCTYNAATNERRIYADGNNAGQGTATGDFSGTNTTNIGRHAAKPAELFPGIIDEVRIYNRVLNENEVRRLYNMGR